MNLSESFPHAHRTQLHASAATPAAPAGVNMRHHHHHHQQQHHQHHSLHNSHHQSSGYQHAPLNNSSDSFPAINTNNNGCLDYAMHHLATFVPEETSIHFTGVNTLKELETLAQQRNLQRTPCLLWLKSVSTQFDTNNGMGAASSNIAQMLEHNILITNLDRQVILDKIPLHKVARTKCLNESPSRSLFQNLLLISVQPRDSATESLPPQLIVFQCLEESALKISDEINSLITTSFSTSSGQQQNHQQHSPFEKNKLLDSRSSYDSFPKDFGGVSVTEFTGDPISSANLDPEDAKLAEKLKQSDVQNEIFLLNLCCEDLNSFVMMLDRAALNCYYRRLLMNAPGKNINNIEVLKDKSKQFKKKVAAILKSSPKLPNRFDYEESFRKIKFTMNLVVRLKDRLKNPDSDQLLREIFVNLRHIVMSSRNPANNRADIAQNTISPMLTQNTLDELSRVLNESQKQLQEELGFPWNLAREKMKRFVAPYYPMFAQNRNPHYADFDPDLFGVATVDSTALIPQSTTNVRTWTTNGKMHKKTPRAISYQAPETHSNVNSVSRTAPHHHHPRLHAQQHQYYTPQTTTRNPLSPPTRSPSPPPPQAMRPSSSAASPSLHHTAAAAVVAMPRPIYATAATAHGNMLPRHALTVADTSASSVNANRLDALYHQYQGGSRGNRVESPSRTPAAAPSLYSAKPFEQSSYSIFKNRSNGNLNENHSQHNLTPVPKPSHSLQPHIKPAQNSFHPSSINGNNEIEKPLFSSSNYNNTTRQKPQINSSQSNSKLVKRFEDSILMRKGRIAVSHEQFVGPDISVDKNEPLEILEDQHNNTYLIRNMWGQTGVCPKNLIEEKGRRKN